jgi:hypothetical protein
MKEPTWLAGAYIIRNKSLDYENEIEYTDNQTDIEAILYR